MTDKLAQILATRSILPEVAAAKAQSIQETVQLRSPFLRQPNFERIHSSDLEILFELYDKHFLEEACRQTLAARNVPLSFRISRRMTRAGGKTTHFFGRHGRIERFEISVSSTLLFETFHEVDRPIKVTGLLCRNRLDALQRIFEHELMHLLEMLLWNDSNCAQPRFQSLAQRFFRHTQHTHELITPRETAMVKYGVRAGDNVSFVFEGCRYRGIVNRITRRATVLVPDARGQAYSDGGRYRKFYIPLEMLEPADRSGHGR